MVEGTRTVGRYLRLIVGYGVLLGVLGMGVWATVAWQYAEWTRLP